ncbi:hypothetical protein [Streptomyces asoensis]|uniref:Uncharacterized protein n=1 Tax=Streptomyces asoensis TaxID=249586 RepID=A0ABQ3S5X0_9ACTN|nr:hypothetical protein [Streptomyces asoensis]GGQ80115.1 hypothetical protein GCM10010496_49860 [Streptomyces asoensis]GHI63526.1 hypothetical protein Saso_51760 [Streptomyces asoensis]
MGTTTAGPGEGSVRLPDDLDPQAATDLLADRYGAPSTLVLDGRTDPPADGCGGAALLAVLGDRAVTIRAWAHGDRWIGAARTDHRLDEARPTAGRALGGDGIPPT